MERRMTRTSTVERRDARPGAGRETPCQVDGWELVELAAEGSMGQVYRARPVGSPSDRPGAYAVKLLDRRWQQNAGAVDLFRRQATLSKEVSHAHLVPILAAGIRRPPYYVVMPWLAGRTLEDRLELGLGIDRPQLLWTIRQVAEALEALHAAGWMHGDVKPNNIFVSASGHATLLDVGFARRVARVGSVADSPVTGTAHYMAPELVTSVPRADIRSDIYSLGVVLFRSLAGRVPFDGNSLSEVAGKHLRTRAPDLRRHAPDLPSGLLRLVRNMLAKEPLRRPQTPCELIERLVRLEIATFSARSTA
jgi:serine/threonine protein kinase